MRYLGIILFGFYRFRKNPIKGNIPWGITYSFSRMPTHLWKLDSIPGVLRTGWFLIAENLSEPKWSPGEQDIYDYHAFRLSSDMTYERVDWFENYQSWESIGDVAVEIELHKHLLKKLAHLHIDKKSPSFKKLWFQLWFIYLEVYEKLFWVAWADPKTIDLYKFATLRENDRVQFMAKESDIIRFFFFGISHRLSLDDADEDMTLNFVSWLEFINSGFPFLPSRIALRETKEGIVKVADQAKFKFGWPVFNSKRRTFWWKK